VDVDPVLECTVVKSGCSPEDVVETCTAKPSPLAGLSSTAPHTLARNAFEPGSIKVMGQKEIHQSNIRIFFLSSSNCNKLRSDPKARSYL
jgi:hypothetical protein